MKLVRTISQSRQQRAHWESTQENVFCLNALVDYHRRYESTPPGLQVAAHLDEERLGRAHFTALQDPPVAFRRPTRPGDPGRSATLTINKEGSGRVYYGAHLLWVPRDGDAGRVNAGIEIQREYHVERDGRWVPLSGDITLERGEIVRVDLYVLLPAARDFVVVEDPVPGALEPVNRLLVTSSGVDAAKGDALPAGSTWWSQGGDWSSFGGSYWGFYHRELGHDAARFYSEYVPAGKYHLSYTAQVIAAGSFFAGPSRAEEMYDPDVYGTGDETILRVEGGE